MDVFMENHKQCNDGFDESVAWGMSVGARMVKTVTAVITSLTRNQTVTLIQQYILDLVTDQTWALTILSMRYNSRTHLPFMKLKRHAFSYITM